MILYFNRMILPAIAYNGPAVKLSCCPCQGWWSFCHPESYRDRLMNRSCHVIMNLSSNGVRGLSITFGVMVSKRVRSTFVFAVTYFDSGILIRIPLIPLLAILRVVSSL
jgi:hypothetical protein